MVAYPCDVKSRYLLDVFKTSNIRYIKPDNTTNITNLHYLLDIYSMIQRPISISYQ
jgi:hypothetical protein